jgi:predicted dehydrogenase
MDDDNWKTGRKELRVLLIGLGSIGRRHLRLLRGITDVEILWWRSGHGQSFQPPDEKHGMRVFRKFERAIENKPDFAIVSNPTALHLETAIALARAGIPFLIEKPVSDRLKGLDTLRNIVKEKSLPVMVGFQLRYHPGYKHLIKLIHRGDIGQLLGLQGYVGQYLPDWRSDVDYRQSYSARKDLGGGVIFDLCHEIDIAISILGKVTKVSCFCDHYSDLKIDSEDMADISMEHQNRRLSHIHLNYLERGYEWTTRILGTSGTVIWDYGKGYVKLIQANGTIQLWNDPDGFNRDWLFREQLEHWLEVLAGKTLPLVNLDDGIAVTEVALAAKRSSQEKRHTEL